MSTWPRYAAALPSDRGIGLALTPIILGLYSIDLRLLKGALMRRPAVERAGRTGPKMWLSLPGLGPGKSGIGWWSAGRRSPFRRRGRAPRGRSRKPVLGRCAERTLARLKWGFESPRER